MRVKSLRTKYKRKVLKGQNRLRVGVCAQATSEKMPMMAASRFMLWGGVEPLLGLAARLSLSCYTCRKLLEWARASPVELLGGESFHLTPSIWVYEVGQRDFVSHKGEKNQNNWHTWTSEMPQTSSRETTTDLPHCVSLYRAIQPCFPGLLWLTLWLCWSWLICKHLLNGFPLNKLDMVWSHMDSSLQPFGLLKVHVPSLLKSLQVTHIQSLVLCHSHFSPL